ncbi:MAG TPA: hypothetical protein DD979_00690 [Gammaproteobacteria bacterium]|jgi:thiol-disulfide isomerase/thioredoxin|nr:hypothetical protein [Gammaproteobacteria bacterium]
MKNKLCLTLLLLIASTVVSAAGLKPYAGSTPMLALADTQGAAHDLSDYRGKVVLVQFWATYCTPCRKEMPSMNRLQEKMGDEFVILAVNMGETQKEVDKFVEEVGPEFTILMDEEGKALANWKVFAAPSNFVVDRDGNIKYTLYGGVEWDSEEIITTLGEL